VDHGRIRFVDGAVGLPLVVAEDAAYEEVTVVVPERATVLLYTDGLIERRSESLTVGLSRLVGVAGAAFGPRFGASGAGLDDGLDVVLDALVPDGGEDDVAVVGLRCVPTSLSLELDATPGDLATVRRQVRNWFEELGAGVDTVPDVLAAVNEAAANAIEHAYGEGRGPLRVEARVDGTRVVLSVGDDGCWRPPVPSDERGRGIMMMRQLVDDLEVVGGTREHPGTIVRFTYPLELLA
jgi:anti-sigma regulatory factor (Ser/Thr protein kinase)